MKFSTLSMAVCALMTTFSVSAAGSVNIPTNAENPFDLKAATIENNSSFSPNVKDNGDFSNLDYFGEGDVAVFAINNTLTASYTITFETATPQELSNADFEILNADGTSIYKQNALIEKTGESGGDWGNYVVNSTLPATPVMEKGQYTLKITMHQGILWDTFTANIRNIAFTANESTGADAIDIPTASFDLSKVKIENNSSFSPNVKDNGDFSNLDYFGEGDVAVFALNNTLNSAYAITFETATPQEMSNADFEILNAAGASIYKQNAIIEKTGESGGDWGNYVVNSTLPATPVMEKGQYTLRITMHQGILWDTFTANIRNIAFTAVDGGSEGGDQAGELEEQSTVLCYWPADAEYGDTGNAEVGGEMGDGNLIKWTNGMSLVLERTDKSYSGAESILINEESYKTIKLSNGAMNTLHAPEGYAINKLTIYSYINYDRVAKGSEGRVCYWKQIGETTYTEETATILKDYSDNAKTDPSYKNNPDKVEVALPNLTSVQLQNTGEQLCFVLEVTFGKLPTSGIENVEIARPVMEDGVMYNLQGIRVDENYRGLVIMNGKKFIKR